MREVLQVKYCMSEAETNEFLKTLLIQPKAGESIGLEDYLKTPRLHSVDFMSKVYGDGQETSVADENGVVASASVGSDVIAIVKYWVVLPEREKAAE